MDNDGAEPKSVAASSEEHRGLVSIYGNNQQPSVGLHRVGWWICGRPARSAQRDPALHPTPAPLTKRSPLAPKSVKCDFNFTFHPLGGNGPL